MPQTQAIVQTLKKMLRAHGLTYRDVAVELGLSEASVKRLFAEQNFSLARLDQVCQLMDMEISELLQEVEAAQCQISELSEAQEQELISDIRLLLMAFLAINGWRFEDIVSYYQFSETEAIRYLVRLDRLKLIELLPKNRIKLLTSAKFSWRRGGPIQNFFTSHLQEDFLHSRFDEADELFMFLSGMLSQASTAELRRRLQQIATEFRNLNQQDLPLAIGEREGYSLFVAFRQWRPDAFQNLLRDSATENRR